MTTESSSNYNISFREGIQQFENKEKTPLRETQVGKLPGHKVDEHQINNKESKTNTIGKNELNMLREQSSSCTLSAKDLNSKFKELKEKAANSKDSSEKRDLMGKARKAKDEYLKFKSNAPRDKSITTSKEPTIPTSHLDSMPLGQQISTSKQTSTGINNTPTVTRKNNLTKKENRLSRAIKNFTKSVFSNIGKAIIGWDKESPKNSQEIKSRTTVVEPSRNMNMTGNVKSVTKAPLKDIETTFQQKNEQSKIILENRVKSQTADISKSTETKTPELPSTSESEEIKNKLELIKEQIKNLDQIDKNKFNELGNLSKQTDEIIKQINNSKKPEETKKTLLNELQEIKNEIKITLNNYEMFTTEVTFSKTLETAAKILEFIDNDSKNKDPFIGQMMKVYKLLSELSPKISKNLKEAGNDPDKLIALFSSPMFKMYCGALKIITINTTKLNLATLKYDSDDKKKGMIRNLTSGTEFSSHSVSAILSPGFQRISRFIMFSENLERLNPNFSKTTISLKGIAADINDTQARMEYGERLASLLTTPKKNRLAALRDLMVLKDDNKINVENLKLLNELVGRPEFKGAVKEYYEKAKNQNNNKGLTLQQFHQDKLLFAAFKIACESTYSPEYPLYVEKHVEMMKLVELPSPENSKALKGLLRITTDTLWNEEKVDLSRATSSSTIPNLNLSGDEQKKANETKLLLENAEKENRDFTQEEMKTIKNNLEIIMKGLDAVTPDLNSKFSDRFKQV